MGILLVLGIVLIPLLYLEEDWRGARELAAAKQRWQDAGYSLNPADYYPPPVPDDQNLAALPVFQLEPDPEKSGQLDALKLREATNGELHGVSLDGFQSGDEFAKLVADAYATKFPGKTPPASSAVQLEELFPVIADLRQAASARPGFRLNQYYANGLSWDRSLSPVVRQLALAKLLWYHGLLALHDHQPEVTLEDIKIGFSIARVTDPSYVGGLVSTGIAAISRRNVDEGLTKHAWNDAQLLQLQDQLKQIDALANYQFVMRAEFVTFSLPVLEQLKTHASALQRLSSLAGDTSETGTNPIAAELLWCIWARGWWDMNAAKKADLMLAELQCVDPKARRVDPQLNQQLEQDFEKQRILPWSLVPWKILFLASTGPLTEGVKKFAQEQVQLDEDRIVCGLERYRLVHGGYPEKLDVLAPAFIGELPHDVMNGEPYHYQANTDGTFLLYSVGRNQVDDGGKVGYNKYVHTTVDYDQGDWVWPMNQR